MIHNIVFLGNPGSGKGTQAAMLASELSVPHISTGDIFRHHMKERTPLGLLILDGMNAGNYTSDELTNEVVASRLAEPDCADGFILDGYPRTVPQVEYFRGLYPDDKVTVLLLDVPVDECVNRLLQRGLTSGRADDQDVAIIQHRMDVYQSTVLPVISLYKNQLVTVEGSGAVETVHDRIVRALKLHG